MASRPSSPELIGQSQAFLEALEHASKVAAIDRPLLVVGERGSGKELFASRIHFLSGRWEDPLIKVNCAAMNDELLESELFGHEAGAFTGASRKHKGRFERAEGGTLFLDEIASASLRVQEKLLRVIEYGEYERVGGEETLIADVRIVGAANVDLRIRAREGKFRADLLDRLAFDVVAAPPLRKRYEDIPLLAAHFAHALALEMNAAFPGFSPSALKKLQNYAWPGNVRELKNVSERALFFWAASGGGGLVDQIVIDPFERAHGAAVERVDHQKADHSTPALTAPQPNVEIRDQFDLRKRLESIEKRLVSQVLDRNGGNQRRAAEALSLTYDQIRGIVRKYGLSG